MFIFSPISLLICFGVASSSLSERIDSEREAKEKRQHNEEGGARYGWGKMILPQGRMVEHRTKVKEDARNGHPLVVFSVFIISEGIESTRDIVKQTRHITECDSGKVSDQDIIHINLTCFNVCGASIRSMVGRL